MNAAVSRLGRSIPLALLVVLLFAIVGSPVSAQEEPPEVADPWEWVEPTDWPAPPPASASGYILMDVGTGQVLASRAPDDPKLVASTVKLLTVLTALQDLALDDVVLVGSEANPGEDGAASSVDPGEQWRVADLLDAIMVRSGNDAARALAGAASDGDLTAFAQRMEETAAELGLDDVTITEPTGLDDANFLSPRALATLGRIALADPRIRASAGQATHVNPDIGTLPSRNCLLGTCPDLVGGYDGVTGLKTGYTEASGWCLVASAERDGRELIAVVLGAREDEARFTEAAALLDYGFAATATEFGSFEARVGGNWHTLAPGGHVWHPDTAPVLEPTQTAEGFRIEALVGSEVLGRADVAMPPAAEPETVGGAVADALYGAMRRGHVTGAWPQP